MHKILDDTPVACYLWMTVVLFEGAIKMQNLLCQVQLFKRGNVEKVKKREKERNLRDNQSQRQTLSGTSCQRVGVLGL